MSLLSFISHSIGRISIWVFSLGAFIPVTNGASLELVHTVPVETTLETPDLKEPVSAWCELFDSATETIDIAQFYASGKPGEPLDAVIQHLKFAGERGVKIRFLLDSKGEKMSEPTTLAELSAIPNLTLHVIDYGKVGGGIIHAKYIVVDGISAYLGSQNFDWRSLKHILETGVLIHDEIIAREMESIFSVDWAAQTLLAQGLPVPVLNREIVLADETQSAYLVASPNAYNPPGVGDSQRELPRLIAKAKHEVWIQVMDYTPLAYGDHARQFYPVFDNAIRAAAQRGVQVHLMVADWNTGEPDIYYLKSLAVLPNVEIKIVTIPKASTGFIPFARVMHTKAMSIDDKIAWVGTSNWQGGYMDNSRNLELVMQNVELAKRISLMARQIWDSEYARSLDINAVYPRPHPGKE